MPFNRETCKHLGTVLQKAELSKKGDWRLTQNDILLYEKVLGEFTLLTACLMLLLPVEWAGVGI